VDTARTPYPFTDVATLVDASGLLRISVSWITDLRMWPQMSTPSRVYLKSIVRTTPGLTLTFASLDEDLCTAVPINLGKRRVALYDARGNQVGFVAFAPGGLQALHDVPNGTYRFPVEATEIVASAIAPQAPIGVEGVKDVAGSVITDDLIFVGGEGVSLHVMADGRTIRVDVIGSPYFRRDNCVDADYLGRVINPVRFISWHDWNPQTNTGGVIKPVGGNISTSIYGTRGARRRGFTTPGPNMALLAMLGP
jgi:hypothetical protein